MMNTHAYLIKVRVSYFPISSAVSFFFLFLCLTLSMGNSVERSMFCPDCPPLCPTWQTALDTVNISVMRMALNCTCLSPGDDSTISDQISAGITDIVTFSSIFWKRSSSYSHKILTSSLVHLHWRLLNRLENLGVIFDDQFNFTEHIASVLRSCRFTLYNIQKIRPYLSQYAQ